MCGLRFGPVGALILVRTDHLAYVLANAVKVSRGTGNQREHELVRRVLLGLECVFDLLQLIVMVSVEHDFDFESNVARQELVGRTVLATKQVWTANVVD